MKALTDESRINAYINKQLKGDELRRFEEELKDNKALKRKFIALSLKRLDPPIEGDTPERKWVEAAFASQSTERAYSRVEDLGATSSNLIFVHPPAPFFYNKYDSASFKQNFFLERPINAIGDLMPDSIIEVLIQDLPSLVVPHKNLNILLVDFDLIDSIGIKLLHDFQENNSVETLILAFVKSEDSTAMFKAFQARVSGILLKGANANLIIRAIKEMEEKKSFFEESLRFNVVQFMNKDAQKEDSSFVMLTSKQREILTFLAQGYSRNQIAESLGINTYTVASHIKAIYAKTQSNSTSEIIQKWLKFQDRG